MGFCLRPNVCKKCGKPLTLFEGWTCLECEKAEQEPCGDEICPCEDETKECIENCFECEYSSFYKGKTCEDAVSRQAVLDLLEDTNNGWIINEVEHLPSVQPKAKTGRWIWGVEHGYDREHPYCKCSECGLGMGHTEYDFCPNCGADMKGEQE